MSYGIIYYWHCLKTNMGYVGQTVNTLSGRWKGHLNAAFNHKSKSGHWEFPKAIREHGVEAFEGHVICECNSAEDLSKMEGYWMRKLNTLWPNGYNMRGINFTTKQTRLRISHATLGRKLSEEHKRKISQANMGRPGGMLGKHQSEESRSKISASSRGHKKPKRTAEHNKKLSESRKGCKAWNRGMTGESQPMFGKHHSEETKQKMRRQRSEETKQKMRNEQHRRALAAHPDIVRLLTSGISVKEIVELTGKNRRIVVRVQARMKGMING